MILSQLLFFSVLLACNALRKHDSAFIVNKTKHKFIYKTLGELDEFQLGKSRSSVKDQFGADINSKEIFERPHAFVDPIPGHLSFVEKPEDAEIRQQLWDEQTPIEDISQRIEQLKHPEKFAKGFEEFMTTSLTVSQYPSSKDSEKSAEPKGTPSIKSSTNTETPSEPISDTSKPPSNEREKDEDSDTEFDNLISFKFFNLHPDYIPLLEQLMEKKISEASGTEFKERIKPTEFERKIVSSEYFNKAAEIALDLNCLVQSNITSISWILDAISIVEETLATFKYKLGHVKWNSDTLCVLIKDKNLEEKDVESIQTQIQQEIHRLRHKYYITTIENLGIFIETDAYSDI